MRYSSDDVVNVDRTERRHRHTRPDVGETWLRCSSSVQPDGVDFVIKKPAEFVHANCGACWWPPTTKQLIDRSPETSWRLTITFDCVAPKRTAFALTKIRNFGRVNHLGAEPGTQAYSAWACPGWMSTRHSWGSKQAYRVIHQPVSVVSQCSLNAWL